MNFLEYGWCNIIDFKLYGLMYNFWNFVYNVGGFFGGSVVVIVSGMMLIVSGSDVGGFICILFFWMGLVGLKLIRGLVSNEKLDLYSIVVYFLLIKLFRDVEILLIYLKKSD